MNAHTPILYAWVWVTLLALLLTTIVLAHVDLGGANTAVALLLAAAKVVLVSWFYMELRESDLASRASAGMGVLVLGTLFVLVFSDYAWRVG